MVAITEATEGLEENQKPPAEPDVVKVTVEPTHPREALVIVPASGAVFIVILEVAVSVPQVEETIYDRVTVPVDRPVSCRVEVLKVATDAELTDQVPPGTVGA